MEINHFIEGHAVPFERIKEALDAMEYGSAERVMFQMLFLTGSRIRELDNMAIGKLFYNSQKWVIYWRLGKNQRGFRKEVLPDFFVKELKHYRNNHRVYADKIFGITAHTFRMYFHHFIMPKLSNWQVKRLVDRCGGLQEEYAYQLKGLRKDYQTLEFAKQLEKWQDASVALEFTSKKMKHSSQKITAYHYIENFDSLNIKNTGRMTPAEILSGLNTQMRIMDFA